MVTDRPGVALLLWLENTIPVAEDPSTRSSHTENTAVANYNIAIYKLEEAKGTLLRYNNVIMAEDSLPYIRGLRQP